MAKPASGDKKITGRIDTMLIQSHYEKACNACGHIDDIVGLLTGLHEDSAKWRAKYIAMKRSHFSKFLAHTDTAQMKMAFREWKEQFMEEKAGRELRRLSVEEDRLIKELANQERDQKWESRQQIRALEETHEEALNALLSQVCLRKDQLKKLTDERDMLQKKAERNTHMLRNLRLQLSSLNDEPPEEEALPQTRGFDFMTTKLHNLLIQVDPTYVPRLVMNNQSRHSIATDGSISRVSVSACRRRSCDL